MVQTKSILPLLGTLFYVFYTVEAHLRCSSAQFTCGNSECIPKSWKCDGEDDCGDGSDELDCPKKTCLESEHTCGNGNCVPVRWLCDGDDDCHDGSDESKDVCSEHKCNSDQLSCGETGQCLPLSWKCDGQADCPNGEDEDQCNPTTCANGEFACKNGKCITDRWHCDGDNDCEDNSDEAECAPATCQPDQFRCDVDRIVRCIPNSWRCDGDMDCFDMADEQNCTYTGQGENKCAHQEFMCANQDCIHESWHCDGDEDCLDGSDEVNCDGKMTCKGDQFKCSDSTCIPGRLQCDGHKDCTDGSDEEGCAKPILECDPEKEFDCTGEGKDCISIENICNNRSDCLNGADERQELCSIRNKCMAAEKGGCMHYCHFNHLRTYCSCYPGYKLAENGKDCVDIDECQLSPPVCSQSCTNLEGSFKCECVDGYQMDSANKHCRVTNELPKVLFANRQDIREIDLKNHHYRSVVNGTRSAIALDYHYATRHLYFSDVAQEKICRVKLDAPGASIGSKCETVVGDLVSTPDGICVDWIHNNLYWTDTGHNTISVISLANLNSPVRKTLLQVGLDEPRALVLDPRPSEQWLYWSDWGDHPKIEKAGLDGSHRITIISDSDVQWPNGLTIDFVTNRLFWIDARLHVIGSSKLDGTDSIVVLNQEENLKHPFAIDVFEDWVYWTDWEKEAILKAHKFHGNETHTVASNLYSPMDVQILHPYKQPAGEDVCGSNMGGCSHMCLPAPRLTANSAKYTCICPDGVDKKLCPEMPVTTTPAPTTVPVASEVPKGQDGGKNNDTTPTDSHIFGQIAAIVVGVLALMIITGIVVGCIVYKSYVKKNVKSMNFDNPVYRKTTEDRFSLEQNQYQPAGKNVPSTLEPLTSASEIV